ncbi:MAG: VapC toxin protein, partial [Olavius algarvensis Gamma 1 endosymbiont]
VDYHLWRIAAGRGKEPVSKTGPGATATLRRVRPGVDEPSILCPHPSGAGTRRNTHRCQRPLDRRACLGVRPDPGQQQSAGVQSGYRTGDRELDAL